MTKRKNPAAVALGKLGGKVGGKARTEKKRKAVARNLLCPKCGHTYRSTHHTTTCTGAKNV